MITIFIRTLLIYLFLVISMRLMGKRQVGELQLSELTVTILLSELAAAPLTDKNIPFSYAVITILLLLSVEVIISFALIRFPSLKVLLTGKPSMIIKKGTLDQKELERQRLCLSELMCALRQEGISDISNVEYAILEENGKLSVFPKAKASPITPQSMPKSMQTDVTEEGIAHSLIIDRKIISQNLTNANWSEKMLFQELKKRKCRLDDIFLFSVSDSGNITIIFKSGNQTTQTTDGK